jgi:ribulose-phosphate 3-epimerase
MATICPTITAYDTHEYREQMERVKKFAQRLHVDFMDGIFAPTVSPGLDKAWWDDSDKIDIHLMHQKPGDFLLDLVKLNPHLVIVHAEADGSFYDIARELRDHDIKAGVALLKDTQVDIIKPALELVDHVLIFSGDLGHFGGTAELALLEKVTEIKAMKPEIEIGWDGGINDMNISSLVAGGVDVLNVGGFIHKAKDPKNAYDTLVGIVEKGNEQKTNT